MTVILGYDYSPGAEAALHVAIDVATRFGEPLLLVHGVVPPGGLGEEFAAHRDALAEKVREQSLPALEAAREAGLDVDVELVMAKPAQALVLVAEQRKATVIVVGIAGESPLRGAVLGSTPHKLLQLSTRPVLCVPGTTGSE